MARPRILFDANAMVLRTGYTHLSGIGRTSLELALALDQLDNPECDIRLLTQTFRGSIPAHFSRLPVRNIPWPIGPRFEELRARAPLLELAAPHDLLHIPYNFAPVYRPERTVATIHDAIFFSHPEEHLAHAVAREQAPRFAQRIRAIAAPSLSAKSDIVHYMGVPPEKVTLIPWGVDRLRFHAGDKSGARERVRSVTGSARPYFLSVSCSTGRKNTISVLRAFRNALRSGIEHDLYLVWGTPPKAYLDEFAGLIADQRVRFLSHVADGLLADLYAGATATFFPSRYEGFGLPILESMACGTPVVTCNNSSLAEVAGNAAIYVDPDGVNEIADWMCDFEHGGMQGPDVINRLIAQAVRFSWAVTAEEYVRFWCSVSC
jgi:glycosyltransferase involved in cell wall biosynthesis